MKKNKLVTILIAAATIILAGVAVFTAVRLFQLRKQSVSPTSPESEPEAFHYGTPEDRRVMKITCNPESTEIYTIELEAIEDNCPGAMSVCPSTTNGITEFYTKYRIQAVDRGTSTPKSISVKYRTTTNWCSAKCGNKNADGNYTCDENTTENTSQVSLDLNNDFTSYVTLTRASDVSYACGSYQTDVYITEIDNCSNPSTALNAKGSMTWGICYTGITCTEARPSLCESVNVSKSVISPGEYVTITSTSKDDVQNFTYAFYNEDNQYTCSADFPRNVALFADVASGDPAPTDAVWTSIWPTLPQLSSGDKCDNPKPVCTSDTGYSTKEALAILTETAKCTELGSSGTHHLIYKDPNTTARTTGFIMVPYERLFYTDPITKSAASTMQINAYFQKADGTLTSDPERACVVHIKAGAAVPTATPITTVSSCSTLSFSLASEDETPTPTPTATTTATPTATATATPNSCNGTCGSNYNCNGDLYCYNGYCRDADCPTETDCSCGTAATATATSSTTTTTVTRTATPTTEASLPNAGVSTPTIFGLGIGAVLLLISLTLAL